MLRVTFCVTYWKISQHLGRVKLLMLLSKWSSKARICHVPPFLHPLPGSALPSGRTLARHRRLRPPQHTPFGTPDFTIWGDDTYIKQFTELLVRDKSPALNATQLSSLTFTEMCWFSSESLYSVTECQTSTVSKQWQSIREIFKYMETSDIGRRAQLNGRDLESCIGTALFLLSGTLQTWSFLFTNMPALKTTKRNGIWSNHLRGSEASQVCMKLIYAKKKKRKKK